MKKTLKIIRENIKRERKKYGYTQEDMAQILNMSLSAYRKIEQGQRKLSLEHIISISNFLNIDLPTLFRMQTNEMDILNQNEKKRKEFLVELLKTFGSVKKIKDASIEELQKVKGISKELAEKLKSGL